MKIKSVKQFKERVDGAFETMKTRDEAKACYDFSREEFKAAEEELCAYAAANPAVFEGRDGVSGWGTTDEVEEASSPKCPVITSMLTLPGMLPSSNSCGVRTSTSCTPGLEIESAKASTDTEETSPWPCTLFSSEHMQETKQPCGCP